VSADRHTDHGDADVIGLLTGDTDRQRATETARHLRGCPECTDELIDLVVAHGALRSADLALRELEHPGPSSVAADDADADPLPPLTLPGDRRHRVPARRPVVAVLVAVAAVVVLVAALGLTGVLGGRTTPTRTVVAEAPLHPIDAPATATGTVTVLANGTTRQMLVSTRDLGAAGPQSYYEVWLLDPATLKMLPVGVLPPSGAGTYAVTADLMSGYSAVDVSLQADDGNPAHSQTSVLRAVYAPSVPATATA
jgi:anti-sigma-K factor RskA